MRGFHSSCHSSYCSQELIEKYNLKEKKIFSKDAEYKLTQYLKKLANRKDKFRKDISSNLVEAMFSFVGRALAGKVKNMQ